MTLLIAHRAVGLNKQAFPVAGCSHGEMQRIKAIRKIIPGIGAGLSHPAVPGPVIMAQPLSEAIQCCKREEKRKPSSNENARCTKVTKTCRSNFACAGLSAMFGARNRESHPAKLATVLWG